MKQSEFIEKNYKLNTNNSFVKLLTYNYFFIILKNWIAQGILGLSMEEKIYKLAFDIIGFILIYSITKESLYLFIGMVCVHTLNWITNDHFVDNLFHLNIVKTNTDKMIKDINLLKKITANNNRIIFVGVYGRIARGEPIHSGSDIDIRIIRKKGFFNALYFAFFGHYIRFFSLIKLIPIDLNIWNDLSMLNKMRKDESPLILKGTYSAINTYGKSLQRIALPYRQLDIRS